jgi:hypothetical protein
VGYGSAIFTVTLHRELWFDEGMRRVLGHKFIYVVVVAVVYAVDVL